jgi:hypothetical protein
LRLNRSAEGLLRSALCLHRSAEGLLHSAERFPRSAERLTPYFMRSIHSKIRLTYSDIRITLSVDNFSIPVISLIRYLVRQSKSYTKYPRLNTYIFIFDILL